MLDAIRKRAGSLVVKILFLILVLSFGVWGIADVISPRGHGDWAAKVGDETISATAFQTEVRATVRRLGAAMGKPIDAEQARALGISSSVLNQMVERALFEKAAYDLKLTVTDASIRDLIKGDERFFNASGAFDADVFNRLLRSNDLTEDRYVALLRQEMLRQQLLSSLTGGVVPPQAAVEALTLYHGERRTAEIVRIMDANISGIPAPDEDALKTFYSDFSGLFATPELRSVSAVILSANAVAANLTLDDEELRRQYQERLADYTRAERRSFRQIVFADEAAARAARSRLDSGTDFTTLARDTAAKSGGNTDAEVIGPVTRDQLPPELAEVIFRTPAGGTSEPIHTSLGWHLITVTAVEPGAVKPFAEVKDELAAAVKHDRAIDSLVDLSNKLDDALGRGASLSEAASELGISVRTISALDSSGQDADGKPVPDLPAKFVESVFSTPANSDSGLVEADNETYFVVHVDAIKPSAVPPLETIKARVAEAWLAHERTTKARALADETAERVRGGASLAAIASEKGWKLETTPAFGREGEGATDLPRPLITALFAAKAGETLSVPIDDGFAVARLATVSAPGEDAMRVAEPGVRNELTQSLQGDIITQLAAALRQRYSVKINPQALERSL
ncbi:MAG: peptidyl-prolyl cis-trans isomerase [Rhodospirillales bacterium]|nr:peptidyl-prolyl cis-trans isomerase [Rhodospirillales bacterium]